MEEKAKKITGNQKFNISANEQIGHFRKFYLRRASAIAGLTGF